MTHQPLTKAEREELRKIASDFAACETHIEDVLPGAGMLTTPAATALRALPRLLADLDAAEAKLEAVTDVPDDIHAAIEELAESAYAWAESDTEPVSEQAAKERISDSRLRVMVNRLLAQRDRAEAERDALKAQRDNLHARLYPQPCKGCPGCSSYADCPDEIDRLTTERDALKAKLDDPRRVLIHETEVVATKEEIAKLKRELADLSEADEELHACRALVNATSENLSVDLERMVDDLAEANEKAARSEKDAHSWCELYTDTKAKLAALVDAAQPFASDLGCDAVHHAVKDRHDQRENCPVVARLRAAIAAARGGAQ